MTKYFGQWETDKVIESYFPDLRNGNCIEVGAYDGIKGSNTKYFEDMGWFSICFEPNPYIFPLLVKNRIGPVFEVANSYFDGCQDLEIYDFESGIQSSLTSLNTDPRLIEEYDKAIKKTHKVSVTVRQLDTVLNYYGYPTHYNFISIDTEGTELDVVKGLSLLKYSVDLFVVENNYNDSNVEQWLKDNGYIKDQRYKINDFFIKENSCTQ